MYIDSMNCTGTNVSLLSLYRYMGGVTDIKNVLLSLCPTITYSPSPKQISTYYKCVKRTAMGTSNVDVCTTRIKYSDSYHSRTTSSIVGTPVHMESDSCFHKE